MWGIAYGPQAGGRLTLAKREGPQKREFALLNKQIVGGLSIVEARVRALMTARMR